MRPYAFLTLFIATCALALANPEIHTTLSVEVRTCSLHNQLNSTDTTQELTQEEQMAQKPFVAPNAVTSYVYTGNQLMQAASEAGSAERPIGKMVIAVIVSGVLFGLGMGM
jgi:hypothetical protein